MPQFIVLVGLPSCHSAGPIAPRTPVNLHCPHARPQTNDDAVTVVTQPVILNITSRHNNSNGCPMPATWFAQVDYTDANLVGDAADSCRFEQRSR